MLWLFSDFKKKKKKYKIRILLYPNLSVYVCEAHFWRLEPRPLPSTPHKYLYLWSNYRTKGVRWWLCSNFKIHLKFIIILKQVRKSSKTCQKTEFWAKICLGHGFQSSHISCFPLNPIFDVFYKLETKLEFVEDKKKFKTPEGK